MQVSQLWQDGNAVGLVALIKGAVGRMGVGGMVGEVVRALMVCGLVLLIEPWESAINAIVLSQTREQIVKDQQAYELNGCKTVSPETAKFAFCGRLLLDIELNRRKLEQKQTANPVERARAAFQWPTK